MYIVVGVVWNVDAVADVGLTKAIHVYNYTGRHVSKIVMYIRICLHAYKHAFAVMNNS